MIRKSIAVLLALGASGAAVSDVVSVGSEIVTFDDVIRGLPFYNFDSNDLDTTTDVVFSTTDREGFNTAGPGPDQKYIDEPGLEGTTLLPVDLRVDFLQGATGQIGFGFALIEDGSATFKAYNAAGIQIASQTVNGDYFDLGRGDGSTSVFPENQVIVPLSGGTAVYGEFDFQIGSSGSGSIDGDGGELEGLGGRYIIDNFSFTPAGQSIIANFEGSIPENPVLPGDIIIGENGVPDFEFDVNIDENGLGGVFPIFIDPVIAVGYDYTSSINVATVLVPSALPNGDDEFEIFIPGQGSFALTAGTPFDLTLLDPNGFSEFTIRGIDTNELLDPNDPTAFVTGLTFVGGGPSSVANLTMTPITLNIPPSGGGGTTGVPEPGVLWLLAGGLAGLYGRRRIMR